MGCFAFIPSDPAYNTFAVDLKAAEVYASMLMDSKPIRQGLRRDLCDDRASVTDLYTPDPDLGNR